MMGAATTLGVIGIAASLYGANQAQRSASRAMDAQERMSQADLDFRRKQYDRYLGLYGPIEEQLAKEARSSEPLDYEKNAAAIRENYGDVQRDIATNMGMRGMAGSGIDVGAGRAAAMGQGAALSGAWSQGLINRRNLGLDLTGRGQIQTSAEGMGRGMAGMADLYGSRANLFNQAAAQGWNNFGQGLTGLAGYYDQQRLQDNEARDYAARLSMANASTSLPSYTTPSLPAADGPVPTPWR